MLATLSCIVLAEGNAMGIGLADMPEESNSQTCKNTASAPSSPVKFDCNEFFKDGFTFSGLAWWIICQSASDPTSTGMLGI